MSDRWSVGARGRRFMLAGALGAMLAVGAGGALPASAQDAPPALAAQKRQLLTELAKEA